MLDTVIEAETPEGILLELRPAGLTARFYAFAFDWVIRMAIAYAAMRVTAPLGGIGLAFWFVLFFGLEWLYPVIFELTPSGATPGKRVFGLRVVMDNGLPVTSAAAMSRNLLRAADFLPFGYALGTISMLIRRDSKRLGDVAAGTIVVHERKPVPRLSAIDIAPIPPALPLALEDQAAVVALATRAARLTSERVDELAALAAVVSGDAGQRGPDVTERVLGVGQWLLGRR